MASLTDKGRVRRNNQDDLLVRPSLGDPRLTEKAGVIETDPDGALFAVADGLGGLQAGEVASMLAVKALEEMIDKGGFRADVAGEAVGTVFDQAFIEAHARLVERALEDPRTEGMGTTLVTGHLRGDMMHVAWIGDSRCYLYRLETGLSCLTKDHSHVQRLVDEGILTPEEAFGHPDSNIITRCLLCEEDDNPSPDSVAAVLEEADRILFCSDGLNGMLRDGEIGKILASVTDTAACVRTLVSEANARGGRDNVTAILVDVITLE